FAGVGCVALPDPDRGEGGAPAPPGERAEGAVPAGMVAAHVPDPVGYKGLRPLHAVADLIAWTAGGDLAIVDGHTGAIRQTVTSPPLPGGRDVAFDPWKN